MRWKIPVVILCLGLMACGKPSQTKVSSKPTTLEQAAAELHRMVDSISADAFPGKEMTVEDLATGRKLCGDPSTQGQDEDYSVSISIAPEEIDSSLDRATKYLEGKGHTVRLEDAETPIPALFVEFDGFNLGIEANKSQGKVSIGGSTPCYATTSS